MIMYDFIKIKEYYFWINYYNNLEAEENITASYREKINKIY